MYRQRDWVIGEVVWFFRNANSKAIFTKTKRIALPSARLIIKQGKLSHFKTSGESLFFIPYFLHKSVNNLKIVAEPNKILSCKYVRK